jgi:hypothetical protein
MRQARTTTPMGRPIARASVPDRVGLGAWFGPVGVVWFGERANASSLRKTLFDQYPKVGGLLDRGMPGSQD